MKIRTQFTLAFLFLAVVPLAVIVLFSYVTSQRALRRVVEAEAEATTREMEERMAAVRLDLARRVSRVGELPLRRVVDREPDDGGGRREVFGRILSELGEAAPFVQSFEFTPRPGAPPAAPSPPEPGEEATRAVIEAPPRPAGFVIQVEKIVQEMEAQIEAEMGERELTAEEREALERARAGVAAAVSVVEGIGRIADAFTGGEKREVQIGGLHLEFGGDEPAAAGDPEAPEKAEPQVGGWERQVALWEERWRQQQEEWKSRFLEWETTREEKVVVDESADEGERWQDGGVFYVPVRESGEVVGAVRASLSSEQLLRGVLARTRSAQGEVPFAVDAAGGLHTLSDEDRQRLERLPLTEEARQTGGARTGDWVVATSRDAATGVSYGIARPIGESVAEMRRVAARNFALGLGLLLLAVVGVRPLSRRLTGSLRRLNEGVERLAAGDLGTRVDIRSRNEIGRLAAAFNRMAGEIQQHQAREVEQRLLAAELARKSEELEEARRFQLSLLPARLPEHPSFELAVAMETATEVGGDYYDFRLDERGALTCAVGDATGHGARAGTMVTVIKSLFSAFQPEDDLSAFLRQAGLAVRRMDLGRMAMALTLAQLDGRRLRLSAAGMPPALLHRGAGGQVEELLVEGMPLGGLSTEYRQVETEVAAGDTLLLSTDGLPELPDPAGEPFGYRRMRRAFARAASGSPREIVASLSRHAREWAGEGPPIDDMTFVVVRVR